MIEADSKWLQALWSCFFKEMEFLLSLNVVWPMTAWPMECGTSGTIAVLGLFLKEQTGSTLVSRSLDLPYNKSDYPIGEITQNDPETLWMGPS